MIAGAEHHGGAEEADALVSGFAHRALHLQLGLAIPGDRTVRVVQLFGRVAFRSGAAGRLRGEDEHFGCIPELPEEVEGAVDIDPEIFVAGAAEEDAGAVNDAIHGTEIAQVTGGGGSFDHAQLAHAGGAFAGKLRAEFVRRTDRGDDFLDGVIGQGP